MNQHNLWGGRQRAKWFVTLLASVAASLAIRTAPAAATAVEVRATYHSVEGATWHYSQGTLRCTGGWVPDIHMTVSPSSKFKSGSFSMVCEPDLKIWLRRAVEALGESGTSPPHHLRVTETYELYYKGVKCDTFEETRDLPVPWDGWSWTIDLEGCGSNRVSGRYYYREYITVP